MREVLQVLVSLFFTLAFVVAVAYLVIAWRRRETEERGIGTVRRLYFYAVSLAALLLAANGVRGVLRYLLDALFGGPQVSLSPTPLALGISFTVVGVPLWLLHWTLIQRHARLLPVEKASLLRKFYLYLVLGLSVALWTGGALGALDWLLGLDPFSGGAWAALGVWSAVWAYHWRVQAGEVLADPDLLGLRRLYLYVVSLFGLVLLSVGLGRIVYLLLLGGYDALLGSPLVLAESGGLWRPAMREAVASAVTGAGLWGLHWFRLARGDRGSLFRQMYLYLFALLGGVLTVLVALGTVLDDLLVWILGAATETATLHFRSLPGAVAALAVGVALWAYHRQTLHREALGFPQEVHRARRTYAYAMSALGVVLLAGAVVVLVALFLSLVANTLGARGDLLATGGDVWRRQVATTVTLALLGLPLWGYYWWREGQSFALADPGERTALSRRITVVGLLTVGMLAALGGVSHLLFLLLRDALEGNLGAGTVEGIRFSLGVVAATALFLPYYWGVYREDRRVAPAEEPGAPTPVEKEVALLAGEGDAWLAHELTSLLGRPVAHLRWADPEEAVPPVAEEALRDLARRIAQAPGRRVLLIPLNGRLRLIAYD